MTYRPSNILLEPACIRYPTTSSRHECIEPNAPIKIPLNILKAIVEVPSPLSRVILSDDKCKSGLGVSVITSVQINRGKRTSHINWQKKSFQSMLFTKRCILNRKLLPHHRTFRFIDRVDYFFYIFDEYISICCD